MDNLSTMRYFIFIPVLVLLTFADLCSQSKGQTRGQYETIQYDDGSYFIGKTVDENEYQITFLLKSTQDIITLEKHQIKQWINSKDYFIYKGGRYHKKSGRVNIIEHSVGGNENDGSGQIHYIYAKLLKPRLAVGLGLGLNFSSASSVTWSTLTFQEVFAYGKYYLNDNRRRLFVDGKLGAAIALGSNDWLRYSSGPLFQPAIGFEFARKSNFRWTIKISQLMQYTTIRPNEFGNGFRNDFFDRSITVVDKRLFNRTMIGVGVKF